MKCSNFKKIREGGMTKIVPLTYNKVVKKSTTNSKTTKKDFVKKSIKNK